MATTMRSVEWLNLPPELWSEVAEKLAEKEIDHLRFRSICSLWRSSTLPLPQPPLPSLPTIPDPYIPKKLKKPCIVEKTIYLLQIPEDLWNLPLMKGFKRSFLIKVSKPFSGHKLRLEGLLSREKSYKSIGSELDLKNLRVTELRKVFYTRRKESGIRLLRINRDGEQLAAMAIDKYDSQLYHYKSGEKEWIQNKICYDAQDVINYQGQFCAVDEEGRTFLFDSSFALTEISPPMVDNPNNYITSKWLVESCGELFMVELYNEKPTIYRLNMEQKAWIQVESLDDRIFFMIEGCSFSLSAQEFPGCKGNCVYFPGGERKENDKRLRFCGPKTHVYDLETGRFGSITSFPEHLDIFWPPPKWLEHPSLFTLVLLRTLM